MIKDQTEHLMWEKIDGTINPEDEKRLQSLMQGDAEAREHFEELMKFTELLGVVDELEPPTALRQRIEGAIDFDRYAAREDSTSPSFFRRWFPPLNLRIASAAAAGLIIGVIGYHLVSLGSGVKGSLDNSAYQGTIGAVQDDLTIQLEGIRGTISFREDNTLAISEIDIVSKREIELHLEYEGRSVRFSATGDIDSPLHDISLGSNSIILKNLGEAEYLATFQRGDTPGSPLRVRVVSGGELLLEEEIHPGRLR